MRALLVACLFLLAGCASTPGSAPETTSLEPQYTDPVIAVDQPTLPTDPPAAGSRTLTEVPEWRLGEWWDIKVTDLFTGTERMVKRVVAGTDFDSYLVGFPLDGFSNDILVLHIPGYGDISRSNLSYEVHDAVFEPLQFPLVQGETWITAFEGRAVQATVTEVTATQATIHLVSPQGPPGPTGQSPAPTDDITVTYDAEIGEIVSYHGVNYADYEVTGHGYGYTGTVRVPHSHDLIFQNGRIAMVVDATNLQNAPAPMTDTFDVDGLYDRVGFVAILGEVLGQPVTTGYYKLVATDPNGETYTAEALPGGPALQITFFGAEKPVGQWTVEYTAGGGGIAVIEGIGYHSIDFELPSGCVVESYNAGHHGAPCRVK